MKIGFNPGSIVDLNGSPLVGRVTVYEHDSDIVKDVYTLEGETYTQASNPQLLNVEGRLDDTLYFDASIVDVKIERYIGEAGQMSVNSPDEEFEDFDVFSTGFVADLGQAGEIVDTIDALRDTPVSSGTVNVRGYYYAGDCGSRLYVWDASSSATEDGGYVIGSNITASGRWILAYDGETIPCTWYGVRPGNTTNMNALLAFPDIVGTNNIRTARKVYFVAGLYDTASFTAITSKRLVFSSGAKFTGGTFRCSGVDVDGTISDYIADFQFNNAQYSGGKTAKAHSSWFRTKNAFWTCGAGEMVFDRTNYFADSSGVADEFTPDIASVLDNQDGHIFSKKVRVGNVNFIYDSDEGVVKVWAGMNQIATLGGANGITAEEIHSALIVAEKVQAEDVEYDRLRINTTDNGYYIESSTDVEVTGIHGKLGERLIIRNMKDGQIVVTCLRDTGYNPMPFHLHFNVNAGNCVELLCTQQWEDVGPTYPTGQLSGWDPICGTITRQKTTDE